MPTSKLIGCLNLHSLLCHRNIPLTLVMQIKVISAAAESKQKLSTPIAIPMTSCIPS